MIFDDSCKRIFYDLICLCFSKLCSQLWSKRMACQRVSKKCKTYSIFTVGYIVFLYDLEIYLL